MASIADSIFSINVEYLTVPLAWIGALSYMIQIYFDFSGYSDMAIGLGIMFGFSFPINFNYPYISTSITEFWRRWHISLSSWFKDYLYIPLGGNRVKVSRMYLNLLIVFIATGIWHGANWTFLAWGLMHGFFIVADKITGFHKIERFKPVRWLITMFIVLIGWVIFRADTLGDAFTYIKAMFGFRGSDFILVDYMFFLNWYNISAFAIAVFAALPIFRRFVLNNILNMSSNPAYLSGCTKEETIQYCKVYNYQRTGAFILLQNIYIIIILIYCLIQLANSSYNPFIYFRF